MSMIAVSFANVTPGSPVLGLLNPHSLELEIIEVPDDPPSLGGIWGIALSPEYVFAATTRYRPASRAGPYEPSRLLVFDRADLRPIGDHTFRLGKDVHSLHFSGDTLYAVSTGTDEVLAVDLRGAEVVDERVIWRPDPSGPREDRHHLNAVTTIRGDLAVSGFGRKIGALWASATGGFVARITDGERLASGLRHPHSIIDLGDGVAYCESAARAVRLIGKDPVRTLDGYARGACRIDDRLFVGTSVGRRVSRSSGVLTNRGEPGETAGRCTIARLAIRDLSIEAVADLGRYGQELYDLVAVEGTERWPRASATAWRDATIHGARSAYEEAYGGLVWLHAEVAERDATIRWLHAEVAERDATIRWLHAEVAERDATIRSSQGTGAQRDASIERPDDVAKS